MRGPRCACAVCLHGATADALGRTGGVGPLGLTASRAAPDAARALLNAQSRAVAAPDAG